MLVVTWLCTALSFVTVHGLFMDMYNELFQIELLDDCSFYVYDRVILSKDSEWCKQPKSSIFPIQHGRVGSNGSLFIGIWTIYADENNIVHAYNYHTDVPGGLIGDKFVSQKFFEADLKDKVYNGSEPSGPDTVGGRYEIVNFNTRDNFYVIKYLACKFPHPANDLCRVVTLKNKSASVEACMPKKPCDPLTHIDTTYRFKKGGFNVKVVEVPGIESLRKASVNGRSYDLSPIRQSISTAMMDPNVFPNFMESFPITAFSKKVNGTEESTQYNAVIHKNGTFAAVIDNQMVEYEYYEPQENYDDRPFFYYREDTGQCTPFFLTYQSRGEDPSFTLRILADGQFQTIFEDIKYADKCGFNDLNGTIAAAPRILSQTSEMFYVEIFFFTNDKAFKYCILDVKYDYQSKNYTLDAPEYSNINSYVHAQTRSTKAANCVFGENKRTRRDGFAFTKHQDDRSKDVGQLFSLSDDVSSPLFPCPGCDETTDILCDVNPTAAVTYDAAYFLLTVKGDKTQVVYIGVKRKGYQKYIEYRIDQVDGSVYFLQQVSLQVEAQDMFKSLQSGIFHSNQQNQEDPIQNNPTKSFALLNRVPVIFLISLAVTNVFGF